MQTPLDRPFLSLILPVLNEAATLPVQLAALQGLRTRGPELIVVDGGSGDGTAELARPAADRLLDAPRGRATQMNAGAKASQLTKAEQAAERAYRAGAISYLEWAQLQSERTAALQQQLDVALGAQRALIEIQRLTGQAMVASAAAASPPES